MTPDKYSTAHRHAQILKCIGEQAQANEQTLMFLKLVLNNALAALYKHGCGAAETKSLLGDALRFQLSSREATNSKCREVLHMGLFVLDH